jgi:uncharacterized protein (TIRG00374 family)
MKKFMPWAIKLALTIAILSIIAWKLDPRTVTATFSSLAPIAVLVAFGVAFLQAVCVAIRLSIIVSTFRYHLPIRDSLRITLESIFFGQTFISFLGSDALRIWRIRKSGLSLEQSTTAVALDRLLGIIVNHALLLVSLPWLLLTIESRSVRLILIVLALAGIAGTCVVLFLGYFRNAILQRFDGSSQKRLAGVFAFLAQAMTAGRHLLKPNRTLFLAAAVSLLSACCNSVVFFVLLLGWQIDAKSAFLAALLVPAVLEIAMMPISIGGWGVREGAAIVAFGTVGIAAPIAFGSSVAFALLALALGLIGGLLWLSGRGSVANIVNLENEIADVQPAASLPAKHR